MKPIINVGAEKISKEETPDRTVKVASTYKCMGNSYTGFD